MSKLEVNFAHEIGDLVYLRNSLNDIDHIPKQFVIVERTATQISDGGVSIFYWLQDWKNPVNEVALSKEMPLYQCSSKERFKEYFGIHKEYNKTT